MRNLNRKYGQSKRRAEESIAKLIIELLWFILKWTLFLPFSLIYIIMKKKK